jgi:membrane-associated phospholipid phosphatase
VLLVPTSVVWIDGPIAGLSRVVFGRFKILLALNDTPSFFGLFSLFVVIALILRRLVHCAVGKPDAVLLASGASVISAWATRPLLRCLFLPIGKWVCITDQLNVHCWSGFTPSGHTAATCAVVSVLWIHYPIYKRLYVSCAVGLGVCLVAANYHFFSEVIAGAFLGISTGLLAVFMLATCERFCPRIKLLR